MTRNIRSILFLIFLIFLGTGLSRASEINEETNHGQTEQTNDFEAGKFVIEHVSDAFEWHIATFGKTHVSVPLPIILYSSNKGWNFFMSSRFHHGHEAYRGFKIEEEGAQAGKIVELN
ncbi:MAG: hypothetical protein WAO52_01810, partial [Prolixibacteraceae bacterium]